MKGGKDVAKNLKASESGTLDAAGSVTREAALDAVKTLLRWAGDDP